MGKRRGKRYSVAEAKARFAECLRAAEEAGPVLITRHGEVVAALVNAEDLATLRRLRSTSGGLASLAGGWEGSEDLASFLEQVPRGGGRVPPAFD